MQLEAQPNQFLMYPLFLSLDHKDLVKLVLQYLSWEEILVFASTCKHIFAMLDNMFNYESLQIVGNKDEWNMLDDWSFDTGRLLHDKAAQLLQSHDLNCNRERYPSGLVDDEIRCLVEEVDRAIRQIAKHLPSFSLVWSVDFKSKLISRILFRNANQHTILWTDARKSNFDTFFLRSEWFDCMLEYRDENDRILFQIGTEGCHPFVCFPYGLDYQSKTGFAWGQSDGSSKFPSITSEKELCQCLPIYNDDFELLNPNCHRYDSD
jgi:hypothetical protein